MQNTLREYCLASGPKISTFPKLVKLKNEITPEERGQESMKQVARRNNMKNKLAAIVGAQEMADALAHTTQV
jgi:hypothetical protein